MTDVAFGNIRSTKRMIKKVMQRIRGDLKHRLEKRRGGGVSWWLVQSLIAIVVPMGHTNKAVKQLFHRACVFMRLWCINIIGCNRPT